MNLAENINQFIKGSGKNKGRMLNERYASFDFCYNYFYSFYKGNRLLDLANDKNLQLSCLQLGFYLASWGMMRGSSFLLEKSVRNYKDLIIAISKMNPKLWEIDLDNYNEENISLLLSCKKQIKKVLGEKNNPSDTLITKIMLGVFANTPAFDNFFRKGFGIYKFNKKSLKYLSNFYIKNKKIIDSYHIRTFGFLNGKETNRQYTKAKIIDMIGFIEGQKK